MKTKDESQFLSNYNDFMSFTEGMHEFIINYIDNYQKIKIFQFYVILSKFREIIIVK